MRILSREGVGSISPISPLEAGARGHALGRPLVAVCKFAAVRGTAPRTISPRASAHGAPCRGGSAPLPARRSAKQAATVATVRERAAAETGTAAHGGDLTLRGVVTHDRAWGSARVHPGFELRGRR
jgi:hypothetical protein